MSALETCPQCKNGTNTQVWQPIKNLDGLGLGRIENIPVIDRGLCHQAQALFTEPLPVDNILVHDSRFELLFCRQVENLDRSALSLESDDVFEPMHDSTVRVDRALDDLIVVLQVDDNDLRFIFFVELLADANEVVRF